MGKVPSKLFLVVMGLAFACAELYPCAKKLRKVAGQPEQPERSPEYDRPYQRERERIFEALREKDPTIINIRLDRKPLRNKNYYEQLHLVLIRRNGEEHRERTRLQYSIVNGVPLTRVDVEEDLRGANLTRLFLLRLLRDNPPMDKFPARYVDVNERAFVMYMASQPPKKTLIKQVERAEKDFNYYSENEKLVTRRLSRIAGPSEGVRIRNLILEAAIKQIPSSKQITSLGYQHVESVQVFLKAVGSVDVTVNFKKGPSPDGHQPRVMLRDGEDTEVFRIREILPDGSIKTTQENNPMPVRGGEV